MWLGCLVSVALCVIGSLSIVSIIVVGISEEVMGPESKPLEDRWTGIKTGTWVWRDVEKMTVIVYWGSLMMVNVGNK